jgi:hypothetical protein
MSDETEISAKPESNQPPASWPSKYLLDLAAKLAGVAFAIVVGALCLAAIPIHNREPHGLASYAPFAFIVFGPFCTVVAVSIAAIVSKQWTWKGACVVILLLPASLCWIWPIYNLFLFWDTGGR